MLAQKAVIAPILVAAVLMFCVPISAVAGYMDPNLLSNGNIGITVDENCNGVLDGFGGQVAMPCYFAADPGPGGLPNVMTYGMLSPPGLVVGDVGLYDPAEGAVLDVIRFNPDGTLVFYSDNIDGYDSGADTPGPPSQFYTNYIQIIEVGTECCNGAFYTPLPGQPGFVAGASAPVTYHFISDVPEPASILLLLSGGALFFWRRRSSCA